MIFCTLVLTYLRRRSLRPDRERQQSCRSRRGQLLGGRASIVHHANPYDGSAVLQIERSVGFSAQSQVLLMRNPPSALCLVIPLGFFGLRAGALLWSLLLLAAMVLSVHMLWRLQGRPCNKLHYLAYSFAPALLCILGGQTAIFALLGLVLFLRFHQGRPFVAGLSLWLCALKPHLFLPFVMVLLLMGGSPPRVSPARRRNPGARCKLAGRMAPRSLSLGPIRPDDALLGNTG